jgi:hypothetical protein
MAARLTSPLETLDDWIAQEAIRSNVDSPRGFTIAIDRMIASLDGREALLGFGEAPPMRSPSTRNPSCFALTPQCLSDFDWLAVLDTTAYNRGGPPLQ